MSNRARKKSPAVLLRRIKKMEEREQELGPNAGRRAYIERLRKAAVVESQESETTTKPSHK